MSSNWYRNLSFYQIWVRSFADGNGDGIGDLYGVYDRLEYIRSLGVDGIWFSPLYPSPNADFGYDISDYRNIHPDYGTLEQFRKVLGRAHELGLKVLMDLVINHTSDEHFWFQESRKGRNNPYSDYYIWRDKPNNWNSIFEGKAWTWDPVRKQYYLHIFAKKQPDLNMDNPRVREEIRSIMRYWLDMGVDGFREDVINFISKKEGLPDGLPFVPVINGMPFYKDGPHIHEYLGEMRKVCDAYDAVQIGEGPLTTLKTALTYLTGPEKSLDMMISFDHMMADGLFTEYIHLPFRLTRYKGALSKWQYGLAGKAWNANYIENHDHPRIISRYGSEKYWRESGTMLAASYLFLQGTPFIYQGQEIGMTNIRLRNIWEYVDVASINNYLHFFTKSPEKKRMARIWVSSRDSSRTPVQWDDSQYAGFSKSWNALRFSGDFSRNTMRTSGEQPVPKPWFHVNPNYRTVNVAAEETDPYSILNFYRKCLKLRKESPVLLWGSYEEYDPKREDVYVYERRLLHDGKDERILVVCSFTEEWIEFPLPEAYRDRRGRLLLDNYPEMADYDEKGGWAGDYLQPYEARVLQFFF